MDNCRFCVESGNLVEICWYFISQYTIRFLSRRSIMGWQCRQTTGTSCPTACTYAPSGWAAFYQRKNRAPTCPTLFWRIPSCMPNAYSSASVGFSHRGLEGARLRTFPSYLLMLIPKRSSPWSIRSRENLSTLLLLGRWSKYWRVIQLNRGKH